MAFIIINALHVSGGSSAHHQELKNCIHSIGYLSSFYAPEEEMYSSITNKVQRYTMAFITINALHVSGGSSAHHQELKNCIHSIGYLSSLYCFLPLEYISSSGAFVPIYETARLRIAESIVISLQC
jgi:hypothetical protein